MKQCRWLFTLLILIAASAGAFAQNPLRGQKWELTFPMTGTHNWTTAKLCVAYTSPTGALYTGTGFWHSRNGAGTADTFKARAAFNETGVWQWALLTAPDCISPGSVASGTPTSGSVTVGSNPTLNPIIRNGPVRVNAMTRRYLTLSGNASRFLWIGDTSWAGPHRAPLTGTNSWNQYTSDRKAKGYTVIQVAAPIGKGALTHVDGGAPFLGANCDTGPLPRLACRPNPAFWAAWDQRIDDINAKEMYAVIVGLFKRVDENEDWPTLDDSKGYARFIAARLAGNYTAVSPGFDEVPYDPYLPGDFTTNCTSVTPGQENQGCRAREVGRAINEAIFLQTPSITPPANASRDGLPLTTLVTHHMGGGCPTGGDATHGCAADAWLWVFHGEDWLDFSMVQSGQGAPANCVHGQEHCIAVRSTQRILALYNVPAVKPVVNGESIYDNFEFKPKATCQGAGQYGDPNVNYSDWRARHTAFNAFLSGGVGFTHGVAGTWDWGGNVTCRDVNESLAPVPATQIGRIRTLFSNLPWQRLVPDCQQWGTACTDIRNTGQPGATAINRRMYASDLNGQLAVAYLPKGPAPTLRLNLDNLTGYTNVQPTTWRADWYNPIAGCTCTANATLVSGTTYDFTANANQDWALIVRNTATIPSLAAGINACPPVNCP